MGDWVIMDKGVETIQLFLNVHLTEKCTTEEICCVNCSFSNNRFGNNYDTNHVTTERQECKILNAKVNKDTNSTEYIIKPDLPGHLGR